MIVQIPLLIIMWIIAYAIPDFVTSPMLGNGLPVFVLITAILSSIIQFGIGYSFYIGAYKALKHKSANMDVLVVLGTTAAWGYGFVLLFPGYSLAE